MKRWMASLLALVLALSGTALAATDAWPGADSGTRTVVNCEEWVSLRAAPDTASARVAQVWLGAVVTNCSYATPEFTYCETGAGERGYILTEYLAGADFHIRSAAETTADAGILNHESDFRMDGGLVIFEEAGLRVQYERDYPSGERMRASCFDASGRFLWGLRTETAYTTELELTDVYAGGTDAQPLLLVNNADLGLVAIEAATGRPLWTVDNAQISLGASQSHAVDADGTLYVGGYYGPHPVAISADGRVLWASDAGQDAVWLNDIEIDGGEIVASFDAPDGEGLRTVRIDRATGRVLSAN